MLASSVYARTDSKKYACGCGVFEPEMRPRHFRQDARFLCAISDSFEGCERLTVQIERVDEVVTARRELGESTEGDAGSFVVAEPPLNRKCVLGLLRLRSRCLPGERRRSRRSSRRGPQPRRSRARGSPRRPRAHTSTLPRGRIQADRSRGMSRRCRPLARAEPRCRLTRLGPLLVRLFVRPEGPGREPRRDQCAHATACGGARRIGLEKAGRVVARRQVLSSDVPVHPEVAAKLEAGLEGVGVARARGVEKPGESGFEIGLVRDALLDRRLLGRALDAVSTSRARAAYR